MCSVPLVAARSDGSSQAELGRRRFLLRAAETSTVVLTLTTIVTVAPAGAAALTSPPPEVAPDNEPQAGLEGTQPQAQVKGRQDVLPYTGADIETSVIAGLAAIAGGGALMYWTADSPIDETATARVDQPLPGSPPTGG